MKGRLFILLSALLVLHSCATSNALKTTAISERNIDNLARINLGMTKAQVLSIMRDPHEYEVLQLADDKYVVWFYVTNPTVMSQTRMVPFNLTPLIFKEKVLIATGYGYYNWLKDKIIESKKAPPPPPPPAAPISFMPELFSMGCFKQRANEDPPPPPKDPAESPPKKKSIEIDEEDEEMIQDEGDQNFNFW